MSPRERRFVTLGGSLILGAGLLLRGIPWVLGSIDQLQERAIQRAETAARARAVLEHRATVRDSLERVLGEIVALAPKLVEGRSVAEAGASLSGLVSLAAARHNMKVLRIDLVPDSGVGVFQRAALHAELEGDVGGLAGFLKALETSDPLLTVISLGVSSPDPASHPNAPEALRVELDVAGYFLPRGST